MNPKIHILILNWNGDHYLEDCISSIKNLEYDNYIITVIDNNSSDHSISNIKYSDINVISHPENYKYASILFMHSLFLSNILFS